MHFFKVFKMYRIQKDTRNEITKACHRTVITSKNQKRKETRLAVQSMGLDNIDYGMFKYHFTPCVCI